MNTAKQDKPLGTTGPFMPERWLLVGPDEAWCERTREALEAAVEERDAEKTDGPSFLAWRLGHGLLQVVCPADLDDALTQALVAPNAEGVHRNATRIWAAMSETDWYTHSDSCAVLQQPSARGLNVSLMNAVPSGTALSDTANKAASNLSGFLHAADQPDALSRLTWLMGGRQMPVPRSWLALAPLPERNVEQNAAMADAGYLCYVAWAQGVLACNDPDELQALWGPFPDGDAEGETDGANETVANAGDNRNNVTQLDGRRPKPEQPKGPGANDDTWHQASRLAASSADGASEGDLLSSESVKNWSFDQPAVARGASQLEVFVLPRKGPDDLPCVEWVARWTSTKHLLDDDNAARRNGDDEASIKRQLYDVCLVVTLPKRKPVLLKGRPECKDGIYSLRFAWPSERSPSNVRNKPSSLASWLRELLPQARVSLL